jgi:hypothetical protein
MTSLTISRPPAAAGIFWIKDGWRVFRLAAIPWMGMTALVFMVIIGVNMIPWIGHLAIEVLSPFLVAGYFSASRAALAGEPVTFIHLGAGLRTGRDALLRIGVVYLVASLLVFALVNLLTGSDLRELMRQLQDPAALAPAEFDRLVREALPAALLGTVLLAPLLMATWFSPGLVLLDAFPPGRALWWSLWACWVNWRPVFYYSLILGALGAVALVIPFGLGMLVFLPVTLISTYVAYQMIFTPVAAQSAEEEVAS